MVQTGESGGLAKLLWRWVPALPLIYSFVALCAVALLNRRPPPGLEPVLAVMAAPLLFIFRPLYPLLRPLGLVEGEWMQGPKPLGVLLGACLYGLILWGALRFFGRRP